MQQKKSDKAQETLLEDRAKKLKQFYAQKPVQKFSGSPKSKANIPDLWANNESTDQKRKQSQKIEDQNQEQDSEKQQQQKLPLLAMTVQIDPQRTAVINVYENDDPQVLAKEFCKTHGIDQSLINLLAQSIVQNLSANADSKGNINQSLSPKKGKNKLKVDRKKNRSNSTGSISDSKHVLSDHDNSVYDRLFKDAEKYRIKIEQKRKEKEDQEYKVPLKRIVSQGEENFWEQMYKKGVIKSEEKKLHAQMIHQQREYETLQECTHHPKINEFSKLIVGPRDSVTEHLTNLGKIMKERKEQQKTFEQSQEDLCTFHPQTNAISNIIVDEKRKLAEDVDHFEQLYNDHKFLQDKLAEKEKNLMSKECPFRPQINETSELIVEGTSFQQRQSDFKQKILVQRKQAVEAKINEESSYFKPMIGRPPSKRERNISSDLFNSLYQEWQTKAENKSRQLQSIEEEEREKRNQAASVVSQKIVRRTHENALSQMFKILDSDGDGMLTVLRTETSKLTVKQKALIKPLLDEMKAKQCTLDENEFIDACSRLMKLMSIQEKHDFLNSSKKDNSQQFSFHPQINKHSEKIIKRKAH